MLCFTRIFCSNTSRISLAAHMFHAANVLQPMLSVAPQMPSGWVSQVAYVQTAFTTALALFHRPHAALYAEVSAHCEAALLAALAVLIV